MRNGFILALLIGLSANAQTITPKDTLGPDDFWFTQADFYVAKDRTNVAAWVTFSPGNRGWVGNCGCETSDGSGTAITPADYDSVSNHLYFSYTQNPLALNIPIHCDTNSPDEKTIYVGLSDPSGYPTGQIDNPGTAIVHLLQNTNGTVSFAQSSLYVSHAGGTVPIHVVRRGQPNGSITVHFATDPGYYDGYDYDMNVTGSAVAGTDYVSTNGTLTFGPGEMEHSFDLTILPSSATNVVWRNLYLMEDYGPDFHITTNRLSVVMLPALALHVQQVESGLQISWANNGGNFALERSTNPLFSQPTPLSYTTNGDQCVAMDSISTAAFYRLKR